MDQIEEYTFFCQFRTQIGVYSFIKNNYECVVYNIVTRHVSRIR